MALEDVDYLGTLLDMFELDEPEANDGLSESADNTSTLQSDSPGQAFLNRVKEGILSHKLIINDSKAKIHTVGGSVLLITPGLFQRYAQEFPSVSQGSDQEIDEWSWVQKQLEKLKVHRKRDNGLNIWTCQVQGPRKKTILKGCLVEHPKLFFELIPPDNPFLKSKRTKHLMPLMGSKRRVDTGGHPPRHHSAIHPRQGSAPNDGLDCLVAFKLYRV